MGDFPPDWLKEQAKLGVIGAGVEVLEARFGIKPLTGPALFLAVFGGKGQVDGRRPLTVGLVNRRRGFGGFGRAPVLLVIARTEPR